MPQPRSLLIGTVAALAFAGCANTDEYNTQPTFISNPSGAPLITSYDGVSDDLLTGGLGWDGLQNGPKPSLSQTPTAAELRKLAIYNNYRALVDTTTAGGYGVLYGPNVALDGTVSSTAGAGKIAGKEYVAYSDDGTGKRNVTLMVQIPNTFDTKNPCVVTATSSGSRGVYGAVSAAGEWGLKHGCAVAYSDKGTGNGAHEIDTGVVTAIDGSNAAMTTIGAKSQFTAQPGIGTTLAAFSLATPHRYAFKHAHSQQNPEKDWGQFTLQAIQYAFYAINDQYGDIKNSKRLRTFKSTNTIVIAASVSNGGGAALAAAEQDTDNLISAVVVGEPQINLNVPASLIVNRGGTAVTAFGKPLYDYTTEAIVLQPCAAYASAAAGSPFQSNVTNTVASPYATNRCAELASAGLVSGTTFQQQADDALAKLQDYGWEAESNLLHASMFAFATPAVALTYANAYAKASVTDNLCGFSFATTDATGAPAAAATSPMLNIFGEGNGIPPTNGINVIYNDAASGAINYALADSDFAYGGMNCLRGLLTGSTVQATQLQQSVAAVKVNGNLHGKPAIIVHGRSDALVPVNHTSRPYFGMNKILEGNKSKLAYIEVENAQHFDTFLQFAGFNDKFVPLHYYNVQALNLMWNYLKSGGALPPSQVVRTTPRGAGAPAISGVNVPQISLSPATGNLILFSGSTVNVPN